MEDWLHRERMLIGNDAVSMIRKKTVLLFGVGGVGSYVMEALVRGGIGGLVIVDCDTVSLTNINRQLIADRETVGMVKTEAAAKRARLINPDIMIREYSVFATPENIPNIIKESNPDYVVDAIDTVTSKISIIKSAKELNIPVISSMGTGSKLDPTRFKITDISKTHTCPLAKVIRLKLREEGINHCQVLFSDEPTIKAVLEPESVGSGGRHIPGSISYVPSVAGLIIGGHVLRRLAQL